MDHPYLLAFLLIVLIGSVTVYIYYLKEKKEELVSIQRGFCPKCHQKSIELTDKRSSGCGSPAQLNYSCSMCGYTNSFSLYDDGGCGGNACG